MNEKGKSHDKLFAFNKIFYEMKKRYNLKTAREWLETEYNGGFYLHDASTSTYLPYARAGEDHALPAGIRTPAGTGYTGKAAEEGCEQRKNAARKG